MKNLKKRNQSGASAIMFAMVFIVVISLISLGFATLARRDQRASLDKNISQEAQLAAESGANSVKEYIKNTVNPVSKNNCNNNASDYPSGYIKPAMTGGPEITCISWNLTPSSVEKTIGSYETWSFEDSQPTGTTDITFTASNGSDYGGSIGRRSLPNLESGKLPIIKVAEVSKVDLYNSTNAKIEIFYLVPANNNNNSITPVSLGDYDNVNNLLDNNANGNAVAYGVNCSSGVCKARISSYPFPGDNNGGSPRLFFFQVIGESSTSINYANNPVGGGVVGVQAEVDVNVKLNDQTKRIKARVPYDSQTWQPWFTAMADQLCKDIKVDGNNSNGKIPNDSTSACLNN